MDFFTSKTESIHQQLPTSCYITNCKYCSLSASPVSSSLSTILFPSISEITNIICKSKSSLNSTPCLQTSSNYVSLLWPLLITDLIHSSLTSVFVTSLVKTAIITQILKNLVQQQPELLLINLYPSTKIREKVAQVHNHRSVNNIYEQFLFFIHFTAKKELWLKSPMTV